MKVAAALILTALSAFGVHAPAAPATTYHTVTIGSCRASGDFATCVSDGNASRSPLIIRVHVAAVRNQSVSGAWTDVCTKGMGAGSKSGNL
jgi:hypothetical protein